MLKHNLVSHCVRFALHSAFDRSDPDLATQLRNIEKICPTLFQRVQTRADLIRKEAEGDEDIGWELSVDDSGDLNHLRTRVINHISSDTLPTHTANTDTDGKIYRLPRKPINMTELFKSLLRQAYYAEYGFDGNIMIWGKKSIQWAKKFRFDDRDNYTHVFTQGDFIKFLGGRIGRVDHIFTFDLMQTRRIFIIVTEFVIQEDRDPVLNLPLVRQKQDNSVVIIGVPAVEADHLYIVNVSSVGYVWVHWNLEWL